jgi:hypothetical protein
VTTDQRGQPPAVPGPFGNPVSYAFSTLPGDTTATGREVRRTLRAIDAVHGIGTRRLPRIPIAEEVNSTRFGAYARTVGGQAVRITVEQDGNHKSLTTAHEIGHFLDHQALGTTGQFASEASVPALTRWRTAVERSRAVFDLRDMVLRRWVEVREADGSTSTFLVATTYIGFLLRPSELWARSYAQYITVRSGDPVLTAQLASERERLPWMPYYPEQWDDDDFSPIAGAIDVLFKGKGWRG